MVGSLAGGGPGGQDTGLQAAPSPRRGSLRHGRRAGDGGRKCWPSSSRRTRASGHRSVGCGRTAVSRRVLRDGGYLRSGLQRLRPVPAGGARVFEGPGPLDHKHRHDPRRRDHGSRRALRPPPRPARRAPRRRLRARAPRGDGTGQPRGGPGPCLAALSAAAYGLPCRAAWSAFAAGSLAVAALNAALLPRGPANTGETKTPGWPGLGWFWCAASAPLFGVALSFGVVNAVYWSFAVDLVSSAGGLSPNAGPLLCTGLE